MGIIPVWAGYLRVLDQPVDRSSDAEYPIEGQDWAQTDFDDVRLLDAGAFMVIISNVFVFSIVFLVFIGIVRYWCIKGDPVEATVDQWIEGK